MLKKPLYIVASNQTTLSYLKVLLQWEEEIASMVFMAIKVLASA